MMRASLAAAAALAIGLGSASETSAQSFGSVGVAFGPEYLGSDDYTPRPFVSGRVQAGSVGLELRGTQLNADVLSAATGGAVSGGPIVRYRFGRENVENDQVDELDDVDAAIELGGFVSYRLGGVFDERDSISIGLEAGFDVGDGHGGYVISPEVSYGRALSQRLRVNAGLSANYGDDSFMESYFSVDAAGAARSGLAEFDAAAGFYSVGASTGFSYALTPSIGVVGRVGVSQLIGDAADSPVVDDAGDATSVFGGAGVSYRF